MLTEVACKSAKCPDGKPRARFADSGGLYLEAAASGSKRWFWKYRYGGKEKRLALGAYPAVTLKAARLARDDARKLLAQGIDPVLHRATEKAAAVAASADTYEAVAREIHAAKSPGWSAGYAARWLRVQEVHLFPAIGALPLASITSPVLLAALRRVEAAGIQHSAFVLRQWAGQVFRYGIATGRCDVDPAHALRDALQPAVVRHAPAILEPEGVGKLMRDIYAYGGQPTTKEALILAALLFQRPGNIRALEWPWIDLDAAMLTIPAAAMKRRVQGKATGQPHLVPLAQQAVESFRRLQPLTGGGRFVFPNLRDAKRPMSASTLQGALRYMGYTPDVMVPHGFRAMARTLLGERPDINPEAIEAQLAHAKSGALGAAYDRTQYLPQRRQLMQVWADYLDQLRDPASAAGSPPFSFDAEVHEMLSQAARDADAAAQALKLAAGHLRAGTPLPANLARWLAGAFEAAASAPQERRAAALARGLNITAGNRRRAADWIEVALFAEAYDGSKLEATRAAAAQFGVDESTVRRYWHEYRAAKLAE